MVESSRAVSRKGAQVFTLLGVDWRGSAAYAVWALLALATGGGAGCNGVRSQVCLSEAGRFDTAGASSSSQVRQPAVRSSLSFVFGNVASEFAGHDAQATAGAWKDSWTAYAARADSTRQPSEYSAAFLAAGEGGSSGVSSWRGHDCVPWRAVWRGRADDGKGRVERDVARRDVRSTRTEAVEARGVVETQRCVDSWARKKVAAYACEGLDRASSCETVSASNEYRLRRVVAEDLA